MHAREAFAADIDSMLGIKCSFFVSMEVYLNTSFLILPNSKSTP